MIEYMTRLFYLFYNVKIKQVMLNSLISNIAASKLNHRVTSIQHHITQFHRWNHQWILINTTKSTLDIHWNHSISKQKYPPVACMSTSMTNDQWPMILKKWSVNFDILTISITDHQLEYSSFKYINYEIRIRLSFNVAWSYLLVSRFEALVHYLFGY